jgi:hypothetical protein
MRVLATFTSPAALRYTIVSTLEPNPTPATPNVSPMYTWVDRPLFAVTFDPAVIPAAEVTKPVGPTDQTTLVSLFCASMSGEL